MKKLKFLACLFAAMMAFSACSSDDPVSPTPDPDPTPTPDPTPAETDQTLGIYVLNEGSYYSGINGSLDYLDLTKDTPTMTNKVFQSTNGMSLGGTVNNGVICDGRMYIASTDENHVTVMDVTTHKYIGFIGSFPQPRELTTDGTDYVYVTSYDGTVRKIDVNSYEIVGQSAKVGDHLEGIVYVSGKLYVCNSCDDNYAYHNDVVVLDAESLEKIDDITVNTNPCQVVTDGQNVYVQSNGDYYTVSAAVQKIDSSNKVTTIMNSGACIAYGEKAGKLYIVCSDTDWSTYQTVNSFYAYDLKEGKSEVMTGSDIIDIKHPCTIAEDPIDGSVYISSYEDGAWGADYTGAGYLVCISADGNSATKYTTGVGPGTIVPNVKYINAK